MGSGRSVVGLAMKKLLLLRHGSTGIPKGQGYIGQTDVSLDDGGRRDVERMVPLISSLNPQRIFCSPLRRCVETGEILFGKGSPRIEIERDVREIHFGRWEGKSFEEISKMDAEGVNRWAEFAPDFSFPDGESVAGFLHRVLGAAKRWEGCEEETILVITHGGIIRMLICHYLGLTPKEYLVFDVRNSLLTRIDVYDGKGVLTGLNLGGNGA